jgi:benzoylformate decarboxylase
VELAHADDLPTVVGRAFKMALQPPTGPVLVSLPQDVLQQVFEFKAPAVSHVHSGMRPDPAGVARAVGILAGAERPLLLVESGVARSDALEEVVRLAELTGCRVYQSWMADVNFPVDHPQYLGDLDPTEPEAVDVLKDVDVLIAVGCPVFAQAFYTTAKPSLANTTIVQIDDDPWEIGKNLPVDCGLQGDIKAALVDLSSALGATLATEAPEARERVRQRVARIVRRTGRVGKGA